MVKGAVLKTARRGIRAWVQILPAPPDVSFIEVRCSHYLPICCYRGCVHPSPSGHILSCKGKTLGTHGSK